jgi:hypothetical protein
MGVFENMIQNKMDRLKWKTSFTAGVANEFDIPGASEASLSKSFNGARELSAPMTAQPLDDVLGRVIKMSDAFLPFKLRFDDVSEVKQLLTDYEAGRLQATVSRSEEVELIFKVYGIEFSDQTLFRGIINSEIQKTTNPLEAAPIHNERLAKVAADLLQKMGYSGRVIDSRRRIAQSKLANTLQDLGFEQSATEGSQDVSR